MKIKSYLVVIGCIYTVLTLTGADLNDAKQWKPIGPIPYTVSQDDKEQAICFEVNNLAGEYKDIYPGIPVEKGALANAGAIKFDIKAVATDGWIGNTGRIITPRQEKHSGTFTYQPPTDSQWKTVIVKLDAPEFNPAQINSIQISVGGKAASFRCYLKNIQILDKEGKAL